MVQTLRCTLLNLRRGVTAATKIELRESTTYPATTPGNRARLQRAPIVFSARFPFDSSCNSRRSTRVFEGSLNVRLDLLGSRWLRQDSRSAWMEVKWSSISSSVIYAHCLDMLCNFVTKTFKRLPQKNVYVFERLLFIYKYIRSRKYSRIYYRRIFMYVRVQMISYICV